MAKRAFGMKTIGVNKFPKLVTPEQAQWIDELVGLEDYDRVIKEADYCSELFQKWYKPTISLI